jgi:hypothetical protein
MVLDHLSAHSANRTPPGAAQTPGCCLRVTIRTGISRSWKRSGPTPPEPDGTSTNGFGGVFNLPLVHGWTPGHPVDHQRPGGAVLVWPWPDEDDVSAGGWLPDQRVSRLRRQIMQLGEPDRGRLERSSSTFQQNTEYEPGDPHLDAAVPQVKIAERAGQRECCSPVGATGGDQGCPTCCLRMAITRSGSSGLNAGWT